VRGKIIRDIHYIVVKFKVGGTVLAALYSYRGADKTLARPGRKQAAPVKTVMGRGMSRFG